MLENQKDDGRDVIKVDYDAQNRIIKAYYYNDGSSTNTLDYTSEYTYNADGRIIKKIDRDAGVNSTGYSLYEYNAAGKLTAEKIYYINGTLKEQEEYLYDNMNRLIRENQYYLQSQTNLLVLSSWHTRWEYTGNDNKPSRMITVTIQGSSYSDITYDANDNITKISGYSNIQSSDSSNYVHYIDILRTFDTKKSALISFSGLSPVAVGNMLLLDNNSINSGGHSTYNIIGTGSITPNGIIGKNNVLTMVETQYPWGSFPGSTKTTTYNYEFDANGNPIKQTVLPTSGDLKNYTFTYRCY